MTAGRAAIRESATSCQVASVAVTILFLPPLYQSQCQGICSNDAVLCQLVQAFTFRPRRAQVHDEDVRRELVSELLPSCWNHLDLRAAFSFAILIARTFFIILRRVALSAELS